MRGMLLSTYFSSGRGRAASLARALGVRPVVVSRWGAGIKPVPVERCAAIERATQGAVARQDLRPDDWRDIWPELANSEEKQPPALAHQSQGAIKTELQEAAHA